jgi:hypothetical protein
MAQANNKVLARMLERLFAGLMSGPNLNCRPHSSRQRIDLTQLEKLGGLLAVEILGELLGPERSVKVAAKVPPPKRWRRVLEKEQEDAEPEKDLNPKEAAAQKAWTDQQAVFKKAKVLADDAKTYEQDTGVHVLNLGFPLLSLPPAAVKSGSSRVAAKRVMAPIAFIPVTLTIRAGAAPAIAIACKGEGVDLVVPNMALLAWLDQQTGSATPELFADEKGQDPWREIGGLIQHVATSLKLQVPESLQELISAPPEPSPPPEATPVVPPSSPAPVAIPVVPPSTAPAPEKHNEAMGENAASALPALVPNLEKLALQAAPRTDDDEAGPAIVPAAVLGLFPMNNQGLLRDMQAMAAGESLDGPVRSFIDVKVSLDQKPANFDHEVAGREKRRRTFAEEQFVTVTDPCQARAVRLARECKGLVIHGPPGTGKSQTITNIIGDHLARGERVMLVCDKRTALDVVANRLEAMGLSSLCALVYDAQRDQRELYRSIRDQLESLTEARSDETADKKLARVDAEMEKLHAELTEYWSLLAEKNPKDGTSFHQLMGQWLSLPEPREICCDASAFQGLHSDDLEKHEQDLRDVLTRGEQIVYGKHSWKDASSISLNDFLAKPVEHWRAQLADCLDSAKNLDATLDPAIPSFNPKLSPEDQAAARLELAKQIETLTSQLAQPVLERWAKQSLDSLRAARKKLADADSFIHLLKESTVAPELAAMVQAEKMGLAAISQHLTSIETYLGIARKWYRWFCFKRRRRAAEVLGRYGLPPGVDSAERLRAFLAALRARLVIQSLHAEMTAASIAQVEGLPDRELAQAANSHAALLDLLINVHAAPTLQGLASSVAQGLADTGERPKVLAGLRKSEPRASAISRFRIRLQESRLFQLAWMSQTVARACEGKPAVPILAPLVDHAAGLESVLRIQTLAGQLPAPLQAVTRTFLDQCAPAGQALAAIRKGILAAEIGIRLQNQPKLRTLDGHRLQSNFDRLRTLAKDKQGLVRDVVLNRWISRQKERLLVGTGSRLNSSAADLRRRLALRGERALRLRQVVAIGQALEGGDPLFDLRPVWLASPETVAQIFPRTTLFDAVIFDEASQCRLEEALPVLTRAKRVVIAGDPQQLPPSRFFESALAVSDDKEVETDQDLFEVHQGEIEDLLGAALSIDIQQSYLDVHYRSTNADLIQFSNAQFYSSRLQPIPGHPSRRSQLPPITLHRVDGVYRERTNPAEGDQVCRIVQDLLKRAAPPSIGIACFNLAQRDLIMEKLDEAAEEDKEFAGRLDDARARRGRGSFEGLFVKNLENVQGDERDHIIISTTYGPDENGNFYRRFGPLGQAGGGRRLNVLVTRAREEVHLVTSIPPSLYRKLPPVPAGQTPGGGWLLFGYLRFAEQLAEVYEKNREKREDAAPDRETQVTVQPSQSPSTFAQALAHRLAKENHIGSDVQWGNEGFCVDIALHDPSQSEEVTLGILCDGVRFSGAEDPVEWDLFRTSILETQGWALHRLWTPHYFRDPRGCTETIVREAAHLQKKEGEKDAIKVVQGK